MINLRGVSTKLYFNKLKLTGEIDKLQQGVGAFCCLCMHYA